MTLLSPWIALLAAAGAIPLLLLLYFLKLRRRRLPLASTLLWRRSFEDLQVNVPFRWLRLSVLLVLQLLALVLLLLALAEPVMHGRAQPASRVILLIDRSASMSAADGPDGRSRLEAAQEAAKGIAGRLSAGGRPCPVMLITFGARAELVLGFESRREILAEAIDAIEPTDEEADLDGALQLAGVFANRGEGDDDLGGPPDVILISDGGVAAPADAAGFSLRGGAFRFVRVGPGSGEPVANVGVASLSARREYGDPTQVLVFLRLINASTEPVETVVTLDVDGQAGPLKSVSIGPCASADRIEAEPAEATATFALELAEGAVLSVRHHARDALEADDTAAVVLPPPARPRVLLVHGGDGADPLLRDLLAAREPASIREMSLDAYEATDPAEIDLGRLGDVVVFDSVSAPRLPGVPSLTFGAVPAGIDVIEPSGEGGRRILSWRRQHPIMRHVSLDTVIFRQFGAMELPPGGTALATGPDGPVIAVLSARGERHVVVGFGFDLSFSTWPLHVSSLVFVQNALDYLTLARMGQMSMALRPGEPVSVRVRTDADRLQISGPTELAVEAAPGGLKTLPILRRVGLYAVDGAAPPHDRLAVSVLSDVESDLRPGGGLVVNAEAVVAGAVEAAAPRALWPWFVAAALVLLVVEWLAYCRLLGL